MVLNKVTELHHLKRDEQLISLRSKPNITKNLVLEQWFLKHFSFAELSEHGHFKTKLIRSPLMKGGGVKNDQNCVTSFMNDPLNEINFSTL